ncbi:neuronal acetylcholine receptor subunit alpha-6-like [Dreissena polymorpha]|nr:neuronal acetylcholine receptor subunit alpha-6-like [Dreissena polymorpha]
MTWTPFQVFQTTCSFDVTFYPFDIQDCDFKFTAWSYTKAQVTMQAGDNGFVFDEYEPNSNWDVKKFSWTIDENSDDSTIIFTVRIQRKPMYFLLTVVLPVLFLAVMDLFTFVLPSDSGEKVSYAVTVFLTFAVFLTIVSSTLPQSSDKVAIIAVFLLIQTGNSAGITLFAVALVRINNFTESTRIPCPLVALMNFFKCRVCRRKNDVTEMNSRNNKVSAINRRKSNVATANRRKSNVTATKMDSDEDFMDEEPYTWKDVSDFLDYFCFILFVSILTLSTLICLNMASVGV